VQETAAALQDRLVAVREEFEAHYDPYPALQRIEKIVTQQCRRIAKQ
jgi:serine/threonine-protein kinase HipA